LAPENKRGAILAPENKKGANLSRATMAPCLHPSTMASRRQLSPMMELRRRPSPCGGKRGASSPPSSSTTPGGCRPSPVGGREKVALPSTPTSTDGEHSRPLGTPAARIAYPSAPLFAGRGEYLLPKGSVEGVESGDHLGGKTKKLSSPPTTSMSRLPSP
jgi:hypothetical protein